MYVHPKNEHVKIRASKLKISVADRCMAKALTVCVSVKRNAERLCVSPRHVAKTAEF